MTPEQERGLRIRTERERRGWSQEFLARRVGLSSSHVSKIELGKAGSRMEDPTAAAIAAAFDWTISHVVEGREVPPSPDAATEDLWAAKTRIAIIRSRGTPRGEQLIAALQAALEAVSIEPEKTKRQEGRDARPTRGHAR